MTNDFIDENSRTRLLNFLPRAVVKEMDSYEVFMNGNKDIDESKRYGEQQKAGKTGLSHVESLIKLAIQIFIPKEKGEDENLLAMISKARLEEEEYRKNTPDDDLA